MSSPRPTRATVAALMEGRHREVDVTEYEFLEDVDGGPLAVYAHTTKAWLTVSLPLLGWTQAEWDDPSITE